jgi:hypothetical protein
LQPVPPPASQSRAPRVIVPPMRKRPRFFVITGGTSREDALDWIARGHRPRRVHLTGSSSPRVDAIAEIERPRTWRGAIRLAAPFVLDWLAIAVLAILALGFLSAGRP